MEETVMEKELTLGELVAELERENDRLQILEREEIHARNATTQCQSRIQSLREKLAATTARILGRDAVSLMEKVRKR